MIVVLEDGLYVADPDRGHLAFLAAFPADIGGRCNDACADLDGNLVTGKLNLGPAEGSAWWYSRRGGWRLLDADISNTNGPAVAVLNGIMTLVIGDTSAHYYSYPYDPSTGTVGRRRVFGDVTGLAGKPDGSTMDRDGGLWCALFDGALLARFTVDGLDRTVAVPVRNPTDVTFGGPGLDSLYVVSTGGDDELAGALLRIDDPGHVGRIEPRFAVEPEVGPGLARASRLERTPPWPVPSRPVVYLDPECGSRIGDEPSGGSRRRVAERGSVGWP